MGKIVNFKNYLVDRYQTWRTGKSKEQRAWEAWYEETVNYRARDIPDMFKNFKHIIEVNYDKFFTFHPFTWVPTEEARDYFWPQCSLGKTCVWRIERVTWSQWEHRWVINEMCGEDKVFVGCNDDIDAVTIALKFS